MAKALQNVENLATAVLTQKFAGEPPTEVKTERLAMAVQRADPSATGKIGAATGGGDFMVPNVGSLFGMEGNDTSGIPPVDTKVLFYSKYMFKKVTYHKTDNPNFSAQRKYTFIFLSALLILLS